MASERQDVLSIFSLSIAFGWGNSSTGVMIFQGQIVKWNFGWSHETPRDLWLSFFSANFLPKLRIFQVCPLTHFQRKFTLGEIWQSIKNHFSVIRPAWLKAKRERNVTNSVINWCFDVPFSHHQSHFSSAKARKKSSGRKSQIMELHSHVKRSLSAPSHHHSFPSRVILSPMIVELPSRCCNSRRQKFSFVNFFRDMNNSDAEEKTRENYHRFMDIASWVVSVYDCFSSTSINKYGNAVRDNKSSFYDHQQSFRLSPSHSPALSTSVFGRQMNAKSHGKANGIGQSFSRFSPRLCVCWKTITSY